MSVLTGVLDYSGDALVRPYVAFFALSILPITLYFIGVIIYNVYFHPLAKYPGPKVMAATRLPYLRMVASGNAPKVTTALHRRYGSVFRIAPDELSFLTEGEAWKRIYATRPGHGQKQKDHRFYQGSVDGYPSILLSGDADHAFVRRSLSHAFSDSSLRGQEPVIQGYVNLLIHRLRQRSQKGAEPIDIVSWYNFATFDIIGDLSFGEPFGCLQNSNYHPWVSMVFENVKAGTICRVISRLPGGNFLLGLLAPRSLIDAKDNHEKLTVEKVDARIEKSNDRPDFFANILKHQNTEKEFPRGKLYSNASFIIVAGSETVATILSGATYLLLKNPNALAKLQREVRTAFNSDEEINMDTCSQLRYTQAVINESLRVFPPVPIGLPRFVDAQGETIDGHWVPGGTVVSVAPIATFHSESNFKHADQFIPERHLGDPSFASDNKDALQPFSVGPRNCIGRNLAYVEMRLILTRIIFNFNLELAEPDIDWQDQKCYTLWTKSPLMIKLTQRNMDQPAA
ncbi:isotrichodermin C-15 hydroxylase [Penicillium canescens]|uniref:isotrichodermin C-15 hydroxylase n=1 Tax=Penicillium canescens TaxID=5083 RepID=UPI0026E0D8A1|nr:isotrichodermin C-15 hydroxylase [Penicillium canescens]KAJ5991615.1 isotrichodermin C-15 hydroxylase [Penicillium canescens]KAJ6049132.1 isotrichodermin C-15 hydroxylase [Penicillium canescens]KAJ6063422.1 isotrichodermin C-15 hydroxylase [Penicillium canescens]KAJ6181535.1 isotrichodermin C-15 hydroxylase [Penicillium canescens]